MSQKLRLLPFWKVAASRHRCPALHVVLPLSPFPWLGDQILWKHGHRRWQLYTPDRILPNMHGLVVEAAGRVDGLCGPVDGQVGQQLVFGKAFLQFAIAVAPGAEFFDNPRRQSSRRIVQPVGERLRLVACIIA